MNKMNIVVSIVAVVVTLSLVGVVVYQQLAISELYGQNKELTLSNSSKDQEKEDLENNYSQLNLTYVQTLNSLEQIMTLLNSSELELSCLQANYSKLQEAYNNLSDYDTSMSANLTAKISELKDSIGRLSQEFGGLDGIFVLNYTFGSDTVGGPWRYTAIIELYNVLEEANVTVKVYGMLGSSKTFTYQMPAYAKRTYVETWSGELFGEDFSLILIDNVER